MLCSIIVLVRSVEYNNKASENKCVAVCPEFSNYARVSVLDCKCKVSMLQLTRFLGAFLDFRLMQTCEILANLARRENKDAAATSRFRCLDLVDLVKFRTVHASHKSSRSNVRRESQACNSFFLALIPYFSDENNDNYLKNLFF